jgi:hypothetical protein
MAGKSIELTAQALCRIQHIVDSAEFAGPEKVRHGIIMQAVGCSLMATARKQVASKTCKEMLCEAECDQVHSTRRCCVRHLARSRLLLPLIIVAMSLAAHLQQRWPHPLVKPCNATIPAVKRKSRSECWECSAAQQQEAGRDYVTPAAGQALSSATAATLAAVQLFCCCWACIVVTCTVCAGPRWCWCQSGTGS